MAEISKRGRLIGLLMALIAVAAIAAHFGAERLHLAWLQPAAELVILVEILGFIVLERYEVFEPVHESMREFHRSMQGIDARLSQLEQLVRALGAAGEVTPHPSTADMYRAAASALRRALVTDPGGPQIVRTARLSGNWRPPHDRHYNPGDFEAISEWVSAIHAFEVAPGDSNKSPWAHLWSKRMLFAVGDMASFEAFLARLPGDDAQPISGLGLVSNPKVLNVTMKVIVQPMSEAALSPLTIVGEREAIVSFEDPSLPYPHWGISYRGPQYAPLFARWFDEIWQSPASYTVFSRDGVHKQELDRIRLRLEALSAIDSAAPASRRN